MSTLKTLVSSHKVRLKTAKLPYGKIHVRQKESEEENACPYYLYGITVSSSGKPLTRHKEVCEHPKSKHPYALSDFDNIFCGGDFERCNIPHQEMGVI